LRKAKTTLLEWLERRINVTEIFSLLTSYGLFYSEVDSRKPLQEALKEARDHPFPSYARWPRVLGLLVVLLIAIEILTGLLLALYYLPTPVDARPSVGTILTEVHFGRFVYQIHFWGAQLVLAVLMLRIVRFFVQGVYRAPRELIWVFSVALLLVCFHLDLSGRALPMTAPAYWTTVRALELASSVPIYGPLLVFLLGGSETAITDLTLIRFYVLHVAVLPALAVTLIYLHFSGVRRVGLTTKKSEQPGPARVGTFRNHLLNLAVLLVLVFGVLVTLAVLAPLPFYADADPYSTPAGVGPPWYLLAPFGFLEWTSGVLPQPVSGSLLFLGFVVLLFLPFVDRTELGSRRRGMVQLLAAVLFLLWLFFSFHGARVA
jgi:quinol-cytochrome oxidoreductase complex cytochrome b subunit